MTLPSLIRRQIQPNSNSMFSHRVASDTILNRLTRLLAEKRQRGNSIIDLTESNPTRAGIEYPDKILDALHSNQALSYEPDPAGSVAARRAVCAYYASKNISLDPENIFLTTSTSEAYSWIFKLLADPGEVILAPRPSYPLFEHLAVLESISQAQYELDYDACWRIDTGDLRSKLSTLTRAIVCVSPNNPTGSFITESEFKDLAEISRNHQVALIADEVFSDYVLNSSSSAVASLAGREECLSFVLSGISKILCLPQMKLGWIVVQGPEKEKREARRRLEFIADAFLPVSAPVQLAFTEWIELRPGIQKKVLARLRKNLALLEDATLHSSCRPLPVEGGWYVVLRAPATRSEEEWALSLLQDQDVLVHPGYFYDFPREAFLVLSLLTRPDLFEEGVRRLVHLVGGQDSSPNHTATKT